MGSRRYKSNHSEQPSLPSISVGSACKSNPVRFGYGSVSKSSQVPNPSFRKLSDDDCSKLIANMLCEKLPATILKTAWLTLTITATPLMNRLALCGSNVAITGLSFPTGKICFPFNFSELTLPQNFDIVFLKDFNTVQAFSILNYADPIVLYYNGMDQGGFQLVGRNIIAIVWLPQAFFTSAGTKLLKFEIQEKLDAGIQNVREELNERIMGVHEQLSKEIREVRDEVREVRDEMREGMERIFKWMQGEEERYQERNKYMR